MDLRYPQGCPMENVDPMVGLVARPGYELLGKNICNEQMFVLEISAALPSAFMFARGFVSRNKSETWK